MNILQNNILPNQQCRMINIVWIDRGIILTIIYNILKKYDQLKNKKIIIDNKRYIKFLEIIFPKLKFSIFKKDKSKYFYFNVRKINKKQDIIIDYIDNYDKYINTNKTTLIPWFDMNDILISYEYNSKDKMECDKLKKFVRGFSNCRRANYNNEIWDIYVENYIFKKYSLHNQTTNINVIINMFNNFIKTNYTNTVIEYPKIYYIEKPIYNQPNPIIERPTNLVTEKIIDRLTDSVTKKPTNQLTDKLKPTDDVIINLPINSENNYCDFDTNLYNQLLYAFLGKKYAEKYTLIKQNINAKDRLLKIYESLYLQNNNPRLANKITTLKSEILRLTKLLNGIDNISDIENIINKFKK